MFLKVFKTHNISFMFMQPLKYRDIYNMEKFQYFNIFIKDTHDGIVF